MKMQEAMNIISSNSSKKMGYRISFDKVGSGILSSDYFPEKNEPLIENEEEAWNLAKMFASKTSDSYVNIYVIDQDFRPVAGYSNKVLKRR